MFKKPIHFFVVMVFVVSLLPFLSYPSYAEGAVCGGESTIVKPEKIYKLLDGRLLVENVPIPPGCGSLIFDGQEISGGPHVFRIFGLPVSGVPIVAGTWYAIRADLDPAEIAIRISKIGDEVWDMRPGVPVNLTLPPAVLPAPPPPLVTTTPELTGECSQESIVVQPESSTTLPDQRVLLKDIPIPQGFNALLFDGQGSSGGERVRWIFGLPIPELPVASGTMYAVCGDAMSIAKRISAPGDKITDFRTSPPTTLSIDP